MAPRNDFEQLVESLSSLPYETEWVEFKLNNSNPEDIGEYLSALSNSARLHGKERGYIVWGIENGSKALLGTEFRPHAQKVGNEELENWLSRQLHPPIHFVIHEGAIEGLQFVVFEAPAASHTPVRFKDFEYVRVGSIRKKLRDHPEKERALWKLFSASAFEDGTAIDDVSSDDVLELIDYPNLFHLLTQPLPDNRAAILSRLESERAIYSTTADKYAITNLGAILLARDLRRFSRMNRKSLRVIFYDGDSRVRTVKEHLVEKG